MKKFKHQKYCMNNFFFVFMQLVKRKEAKKCSRYPYFFIIHKNISFLSKQTKWSFYTTYILIKNKNEYKTNLETEILMIKEIVFCSFLNLHKSPLFNLNGRKMLSEILSKTIIYQTKNCTRHVKFSFYLETPRFIDEKKRFF